MYHDGVKCRRSWTYGYRLAIDGDVDCEGKPVKDFYITIVRIDACPVPFGLVEKDGCKFYEPKDVPQAFPISHGGTYYGYGKSKLVNHGAARWIQVYRNGESCYEQMYSYVKTPYYVVQDGVVYVGAVYREHDEAAKKILLKQSA